jgi:hypothetical protein
MQMRDWNNYRNRLLAAATGLGKPSPDTVRGYGILGEQVRKQDISMPRRGN